MAEELQSLLEKIQRDGIEKAAAERDEIVKNAQNEAAAILAAARAEADKMRNDAANEADALKKRAESAIRQAARDVLLELKSELQRRVAAITRSRMDEALSSEFIAALVRDIASAVLSDASKAASGKLEVMVSPAKCEEVTKLLTASVGADLVDKMTLFPNAAAGRGLKVSVEGNEVFFDFSDAALTGMICEYAGSRISAVIAAQDK